MRRLVQFERFIPDGSLMSGGRKGVIFDSFSSAEHGFSITLATLITLVTGVAGVASVALCARLGVEAAEFLGEAAEADGTQVEGGGVPLLQVEAGPLLRL